MREILFRGKRVDNGEWVYGSLIKLDDEFVYICPKYECASSMSITEIIKCSLCPVIPETVGEFTGLTDCNGKKIFEGDIIKTCSSLIGEIKFGSFWDYEFEFEFYGFAWLGKDQENMFYSLQLNDNWTNHKVIGNIHDNPKLLGVE